MQPHHSAPSRPSFFRISELLVIPHNYQPQLDYLRCLAIALVFLTHTASAFISLAGSNFLTHFPPVVAGWTGVDLFFVLSGFLIGGQIWSEYKSKGRIDLKRFFIKRTLRIWPLYYFVGILFILIRGNLLPGSNYPYSDLYFLSNFLGQGVIFGSWSLSAEEQFYILLPLITLAFAQLKLPYRAGRYLALFMLLASPIIRYFWWNYILTTHEPSVMTEIKYLQHPFHTHMDSLFMGVLLANIYMDKSFKDKWKLVGIALLAITALLLFLRMKYKIMFNYSSIAFLYGTLLWWSLHTKDYFSTFLSYKVVPLFARLSFGIYLFHYQFIEWLMPHTAQWFSSFSSSLNYVFSDIVIFLASAVAATFTYVLIEIPALRYRTYLVGTKSNTRFLSDNK